MADITWHYPQSVKEALALTVKFHPRAVAVAGATTLALRKIAPQTHLIDLSRCGLDELQAQPKKLTVGAMVRVADLTPAAAPGAEGAFISFVASNIASTPLRNAITVGGNVVRPFSWSELPIVCAALDAQFVIGGPVRTRRVPILAYYEQQATSALGRGELLLAIEVARQPKLGWSYQLLRRTATDYALLSVACALTLKKGRIDSCTLVAGAVRPRPVLLSATAALLKGALVTDELLVQVAPAARRDVEPTNDFRASRDYLHDMVGVFAQRAVAEAIERARAAS
jgi:aerobic carbon-monoxide dehydrogenase medium subunit